MTAPRPVIGFGRHSRSAYQVWGAAGYASAALLAVTLAARAALSIPVVLFLALLAAAVFLALALATKAALRAERLIYYHHEIAVLAATALAIRLLHLPVLAYLDVVAAGLGVFLAFGRLGCASVGCCYGKPAARGMVYGMEHAEAGFPARLCGVCLLPVQCIEAACVAALAGAAAVLVWRSAPAGAAFTLYTAGYALVRFLLEFWRGDDERGYAAGFSAAQWTSALVWVAMAARLPLAAAVLPAAMLGIAVFSRRERPWRCWFEARHVHELAGLLGIAHRGPAPMVFRTSRGLLLSAGSEPGMEHYTLSSAAAVIPPGPALRLARLLANLRGRSRFDGSLVRGRHGIVHVVLPAGSR